MKKSSMKTAPNGSTPPTITEKVGCMYHTCSGTCLGIWLIRTGSSPAFRLYPKYEPRKTRGTEIPNHSTSSANIVPKGTAPDDFSPHTKKLSVKKTMKTMPGKRLYEDGRTLR